MILANVRQKCTYSQDRNRIVCQVWLVTLQSCLEQKSAFSQRQAVPCEIYIELAKFSILELTQYVLFPSFCHVTKCPWLDLVGICKPRGSRRDVCGRRESCDVEQTVFGIPWLKSDFWEVVRGDSTKSPADLCRDKTFYGAGTLPAWKEVGRRK